MSALDAKLLGDRIVGGLQIPQNVVLLPSLGSSRSPSTIGGQRGRAGCYRSAPCHGHRSRIADRAHCSLGGL